MVSNSEPPLNSGSISSDGPGPGQLHVLFVIGWLICAVFYFIQYSLRSAPGVMIPQMGASMGVGGTTVTSIIGVYFYTYALFALVSGVALDRIGPRFVAPAGILMLAGGSILFASGYVSGAYLGRLLQGAGSGVAFTSAVFLATRGFPKEWLATAVGTTQCFGMLGGFAGQAVAAPVIHNEVLEWQQFWFVAAGILILIGLAALAVIPHTRKGPIDWRGMAGPYWVVLGNPQSWLCGLVAGLMFLPTNIADMVWGVPFQTAIGVEPGEAATRVAMVPLGWVIGCPALGYVADYLGRRKPVVFGGILVMLASGAAIVYPPPGSTPPFIMGLIFGIASGAAMIPYTIIKEANPGNVSGTATGVINFLVFGFSALMTTIVGAAIVGIAAGGDLALDVFRKVDLIYIAGLILALVLLFFIRETGSGKKPDVPVDEGI